MLIAVSIVDDDVRIRESLSTLLNASPGFCCASCHPDAEHALAEIPKVRPNVTLMDINLPGLNGIECVRRLKPRLPSNEIIILTAFQNARHIFDALSAGASGYLLKQIPVDELLAAIRGVHDGGSPMSASIARKVVQSFQWMAKPSGDLQMLTAREKEILRMLARGCRYREIASELNIAYTTVHTHIRKIYDKLQVRSRTEATVKFLGNTENLANVYR